MRPTSRSVLVGFADALAAPEAAASLLSAGHHVVSFARRGHAVALRKLKGVEIVEVASPEEDFDACIREVRALAGTHEVTMPLDDQALLVCDGALPSEALLVGPRGPQATLALDKRLQLRSAAAAGLEVPPWSELDPGADPPEGLEWPLMIKPALAAEVLGGRLKRFAPRLVASSRELQRVRSSWDPCTPAILQQWVRGEGCGVFGLAHGDSITHLSAHRRVRMMNPAGSGSSACASTPVPEPLVDPIRRMLATAEWRGMFMVELLRAGDRWWFMELNGRPWGSLALARRLGFEYPAWAVAEALDEQASLPSMPPFGELLCRHLGRELVHLIFVLRGPRTYAGPWPTLTGTLRDLLHRESPTAWYNLAPGMRGVFVDDTWRTVVDQTLKRRS